MKRLIEVFNLSDLKNDENLTYDLGENEGQIVWMTWSSSPHSYLEE